MMYTTDYTSVSARLGGKETHIEVGKATAVMGRTIAPYNDFTLFVALGVGKGEVRWDGIVMLDPRGIWGPGPGLRRRRSSEPALFKGSTAFNPDSTRIQFSLEVEDGLKRGLCFAKCWEKGRWSWPDHNMTW